MTKEQFAEWRSNPTTIEVTKALTALRNALMENMADGQTIVISDIGSTAIVTMKFVGKIEGLNEFLNLEYEDESCQ